MNKPIWTIDRTPDAEWAVESVRHLSGAENQGRRHIFVDALGPDGADLRGAGLRVAYGWDGMGEDETPPPAPIDKPAGEFGCHIPIFPGAVMHVSMHGARSDAVHGLHTSFTDEEGEDGNSFGCHSFHVVFRQAPPAQASLEPPKPKVSRRAAAPPASVAEPGAAAGAVSMLPPVGPVWAYRPQLAGGAGPSHTTTFGNGLSAQIVETGNVLYLASITLPNGERIGQTRYFHSLEGAMIWAESQAHEAVGAL
jgi:hypothetical protein